MGQAESVGTGDTSAGINLRSTLGDACCIHNTGLIEGAVQGAGAFSAGKRFAVFTEETTTNGVLVNQDGRPGGDILLWNAGDLITNTGISRGAVSMLAEDDAIVNSGIITGNVLFGEGSDTMLMRGAGVILGRIQGDGGGQ